MDVFEAPETAVPADAIDGVLTIDVYDTGSYGNKFDGTVNSSGDVSFSFESTGAPLTLSVTAYDIDGPHEIRVYLDGKRIAFLPVSENNALVEASLVIPASKLATGTHVLTFNQNFETTRVWGVTDILLTGANPHSTSFAVDPEFSADGFVVWQTDDALFYGRFDMTTGVLLDTMNEIDGVSPVPIFGAPGSLGQGPEIVQNEDGVGAVANVADGLYYYNAEGGYLLPGTAGFHTSFLPKGDMQGLRFAMLDKDDNAFLYDNGTITQLDLGGGTVASWLNSHEFLVSQYATGKPSIGIYDIDTGAVTVIAHQTYGYPGYQAAYESSSGAQYVVLSAGAYDDIWHNTAGGWKLLQHISSPFAVGNYFYSPEFFEMRGEVFLSGYVGASRASAGETAAVLYGIESKSWAQIGAPGDVKDPEVVVLNGDTIYCSFYQSSDDSVKFISLTPAEIDAAWVPSASVTASLTESPAEMSGPGLPSAGGALAFAVGTGAYADMSDPSQAPVGAEPTASGSAVPPNPASDWAGSDWAGGDHFVFGPHRVMAAEHKPLQDRWAMRWHSRGSDSLAAWPDVGGPAREEALPGAM